eukprot:747833-Hanusia_phi.AAC.3
MMSSPFRSLLRMSQRASGSYMPKTMQYRFCQVGCPEGEVEPVQEKEKPLLINEGARVLLSDDKHKYVIRLKLDGKFDTHMGHIKHIDIMRTGYGGKVSTAKGKMLLASCMTLEEYVLTMPRSATPIYPKDAATIVMLADLENGARVIESGTGSGGLSLFLSRAVGPDGVVWSFERRLDSLRNASRNISNWLARNDEAEQEEVRSGDSSKDLQGLTPELRVGNVLLHNIDISDADLPHECADAIILDMMEPWLSLPSVEKALKYSGSLILLCPNITQITHFMEVLGKSDMSFKLTRVIEVSNRHWDVRLPVAHPSFRQIGHTGFIAQLHRLRKQTKDDPEPVTAQPEEDMKEASEEATKTAV